MSVFNPTEPEPQRFVYPERVCEGCGRKGGGHPTAGQDNVLVAWGHKLCGYCIDAFNASLSFEAMVAKWVRDRRAQGGP